MLSHFVWKWLSADGCMAKAPLTLEAVGKNPADGGGVPLSPVVSGANRNDVSRLETLLDAFVSIRPDIFDHAQPGIQSLKKRILQSGAVNKV
jgi:putative transposase